MANVISPKIAAIVLAAGASSRMGRSKQLLTVDGKSLVSRAAAAALEAGCDPIVVVTGAGHESVMTELSQLPIKMVFNSNWSLGMGSSLRAGMTELLDAHPDIKAAAVLVCDQPKLNGNVLRSFLQAWAANGKPMAACRYAGTLGPPCCFASAKFADFLRINDAQGAKQLLLADPGEVTPFDWPEGAIDLDTPQDLEVFSRNQAAAAKLTHNLPC